MLLGINLFRQTISLPSLGRPLHLILYYGDDNPIFKHSFTLTRQNHEKNKFTDDNGSTIIYYNYNHNDDDEKGVSRISSIVINDFPHNKVSHVFYKTMRYPKNWGSDYYKSPYDILITDEFAHKTCVEECRNESKNLNKRKVYMCR